jgi:phytoene/squalene synthetase
MSAIYAFAATIAGVAENRSLPVVERVARIHAWQRRLHAAVDVERSGRAPDPHEDAAVVALAHSIRSLDLPMPLLDDLVSAFGQDTMTTRYDSWAGLFDYCRCAAQPFGRLLLRVAGYRDDAIDRSSDALCTALRLTACWRAFGDDWLIGRLYVPRDVTAACRAREMDLDAPFLNESWAAAIRQCVDQTRVQFEAGRAVCDTVTGGLRRERRWTWLSGMRLLDAVERAGPALKARRPGIDLRDTPALLWRSTRWPSAAS